MPYVGKPVPGKKRVPRLISGEANSVLSIVHRDNKGNETTVHETNNNTKVSTLANKAIDRWGVSGFEMHLTIPGPERSFMTVRVGVNCNLPHGPTFDDARKAIEKAEEIVSDKLDTAAKEAQEFFRAYGRK